MALELSNTGYRLELMSLGILTLGYLCVLLRLQNRTGSLNFLIEAIGEINWKKHG